MTQSLAEITARLHELRQEHRDLDQAIERMADNPAVDQLQLRRLKKRKLRLRDQIAWYESQMIPDLDA
ncbi:YdcH family protein [Wenzhouxiangella sp. EGI_FJ10305]|uniref:YdcH family protein n=1 Tax=Wenzhouxiangella sp. EGI_FJ10305 TaxID=3243768 RepID=UPI0035DEC502